MRRVCGGLPVLVLAAGTALAVPVARNLPVVPVRTGDIPSAGNACQASVRPGFARIGQRVLYRGRILLRRGADLRWQVPAGGGAFEWGSPRIQRIPAYSGSRNRAKEALFADTLQVEISLQAFAPGMLTVPGLGFEVRETNGSRWTGQLPVVRLAVVPVLNPDDTRASLRPLRGPLGAPWWERVPWPIVGSVALACVVFAFIVWRMRRRRAPIAEDVRVRPAKDPVTVAIEALAALRGLRLPEQGRYAGHAFELTRILRRFLEATQDAPRPGDSTPELLVHLGAARLTHAERQNVAELLATWDRVKFARVASSPVEARWAEDAVEGLVRRRPAGAGEGGA
jgi:hypothetical protein